MYLNRTKKQMILRAESREGHNDRSLARVFEDFRNNGNQYIKPDEIQKKLVDLSFNQKSQNIAGHQIADLVAYPIGRHVLDATKPNIPFDTIEGKLHKKNGAYLNCGLKIFP
jgi:Fe-S cluster assembly scaffold protein SufB